MTAYSKLQEREFALAAQGYGAIKHQAFVGTGYFDTVAQTISSGHASTVALKGSTEEAQFQFVAPNASYHHEPIHGYGAEEY